MDLNHRGTIISRASLPLDESSMVLTKGFEPLWIFYIRRILSPLCLPVPPRKQEKYGGGT